MKVLSVQGFLREGEGSIRLTSSLRKVVLRKRPNIVSVGKADMI
jgi:hypothetical protein